ncbi:hypothetical protein [Haloplanus aerogenes]|uniref:hypothetical protein n=1 Tax=Haloplanus aerogenes TaxID=660522 RepID=UPI001F542A26|nr:hypothetical protein [Haloplanus aerogenes]
MDPNAPKSLVEGAYRVVEIINISRTRLLIVALKDELEEPPNNEGFRRQLSDAYLDSRVEYDTVERSSALRRRCG